MKILIYDNNQDDLLKFCTIVRILPFDLFVDKVSHYQDGIDFYNRYMYDIVFIDFVDDIGKKLLNSILEINPKQRVVTMSEVSACSDFMGCENCKQKYNKQRILKPVLEKELFKIISNKEYCPMYCDEDLALDMALISQQFNTLKFDKTRFIFKKDGIDNKQKNIAEMIELTYELNEKKVKFEFVDGEVQIIR